MRENGRFVKEIGGNVSVVAAVSVLALAALTGGVVDYVTALSHKAKLQAAVDSGALQAARELRENGDLSDTELQTLVAEHVQSVFGAMAGGGFGIEGITAARDATGYGVRVTVRGSYGTSFLRLLGIGRLDVDVKSSAAFGHPPLEVALVLDSTGSMDYDADGNLCDGAPGCVNRMSILKTAVENFVTELERNSDGDPESIRVGVVPYSHYVRVESSLGGESWIDMSHVTREECSLRQGPLCLQYTTVVDWDGFLGFRGNGLNETDDSYDVQGVPAVNGDSPIFLPALAPILPLTPLDEDGRQVVLDRVDEMQPDGGTYIPGGLIWGARLLSPQAPFTEGTDATEVVRRGLRKVIVLMTDGINTCSPDGGDEGYVQCNNGNDVDTAGLESMDRICAYLREIDPATGRRRAEIVTVGFDLSFLDSADRDLVEEKLRSCATLGFFSATSRDIASVFGRIGAKLAKLHLTE